MFPMMWKMGMRGCKARGWHVFGAASELRVPAAASSNSSSPSGARRCASDGMWIRIEALAGAPRSKSSKKWGECHNGYLEPFWHA